MKDRDKIIIAVAVGGGAFLIWKNWDKISEMFKKKDATDGGEPKKDDDVNKGGGTSDKPTYSAYQLKVMKLQGVIGAAIDGIVGDQTNRMTKEYFPNSFAKLGDVTPSNIDAYIALGDKRETAYGSSRIDEIWNAMGSGTPAVVRVGAKFAAYYFDSSRNTYLPTGGTFEVKGQTKLYKSTSVKVGSGLIADVQVYNTAGSSLGLRKMLIPTASIYVP